MELSSARGADFGFDRLSLRFLFLLLRLMQKSEATTRRRSRLHECVHDPRLLAHERTCVSS